MYVGVCTIGLLMFGVLPIQTASFSSSGNSLIVCPVDTVVTAGKTVQLRCTAHPSDTIRWFRGSESKPNTRCIYRGNGFYEDAVDMNRFSIRPDVDTTGTADLVIADVRPEDVGVYMCIGLQSNTRGVVKLAIVEQLVNSTSSINLVSNAVTNQCRFRYFGPMKPTAEWLDVTGNPIIGNLSESSETEGLVTTSTNDPSAVHCRLSFQLASCGQPVSREYFGHDVGRVKTNRNEGTPAPSAVSTDGPSWMHLWAWTASSLAVVFCFTTLVMCCVKTRRPRANSCKHFGIANTALISSQGTVNDKPHNQVNTAKQTAILCEDDGMLQSGHDASMDSGFDFVNDTQIPPKNEYEGLKFDDLYTQLNRPTDDYIED